MRAVRPHLLLAAIVVAAGCERAPDPRRAPVPLECGDQMSEFLSHARFWVPNDASSHRWRFHADGRFELWLDGAPGADLEDELGEHAFDGERRIEGRWEATMTTLFLRELPGDEELTYPLDWVDGRKRIEIAGLRYKVPPPPGEGGGGSPAL